MAGHGGSGQTRSVVRVRSFARDGAGPERERFRSSRCRVRVTHASVGVTDLVAHRGDYLLHPRPGFVSGYDFVGVLECVDRAVPRGASAFGGAVGHQKAATAAGAASTLVRRGEVLCSVPFDVAVRRAAYRRDLRALFDDVAAGDLVAPDPVPYPVERFRDALDAAGSRVPGTKVVLTFDQ